MSHWEAERSWNHYKLQTGTRNNETKYREFLDTQYPSVWNSFRAFEATRYVYNHLAKLGIMTEFKQYMSDHCNFLDTALCHDSVLHMMKDVLSVLSGVFNAMTDDEKKTLVMESLLLCVNWHLNGGSPSDWLFSQGNEIGARTITHVTDMVCNTGFKSLALILCMVSHTHSIAAALLGTN